MAEDHQQRKNDLCAPPSTRHQPMTEDLPGPSCHQSMPAQLSKEKLYQKRQKCELRRLLKHTHPELKRLDDVVDEELADVLSSDTNVTTGETGYEGEVLSRRLIFENCASSDRVSPYTPKKHVAEGREERDSDRRSPAVFEDHKEKACNESVKGIVMDGKTQSPDTSTEYEEETVAVDFHAARRMFESQCVNASRVNTVNKSQENTSLPQAEREAVQNQKCRKEDFSSKNKSTYLTDPSQLQRPCVPVTDHELPGNEEVIDDEIAFEEDPKRIPDPEQSEEIIKTRDILLRNNPFISTNIEREKSLVDISKSQDPAGDSEASQDCVITNVKDRAHLFESMPFDKIRQQNKDEIETMVENIKDTLNSLYQANAILSGGSIIEVNETMIAKKAKFTLSDSGPLINYEKVAEGGAQNFLLQLLPRTNLKPQIMYLKEDRKGKMEATKVNVPVHQHQFTNREDTEFKTANVAQVVEDILNQDNSLRKGVIIQEDVERCAEVIVYSLYYYFDEEDVKSYCSLQGPQYYELVEVKDGERTKMESKESVKGTVESTTGHLQEQIREDQISSETIRPEITVKGNVKLFKSCIEKGDLEYLKSLQPAMGQEQELSTDQNVAGEGTDNDNEQRADEMQEGATEWVPVDVKRLKNMFSQDARPVLPKQNTSKNPVQSTNLHCAFTGHNNIEKTPSYQQCSTGVLHQGQSKNTSQEGGAQTPKEVCQPTVPPSGSHLALWMQDDDRVHQAELVEVVDDDDEITNLQNAIHNLQQATIEAKSWQQSLMEKQKIGAPETSNVPVVSFAPGDAKHLRTESELSQENNQKIVHSCPKLSQDELPSASNMTSEEQCVRPNKNAEDCTKDNASREAMGCSQTVKKSEVHPAPTSEAAEQSDEEVVFQGKLQAALDSLERSNINVTRGDFRAAMIYRNTSKQHRETSPQTDVGSVQKPNLEECSLMTEPQSSPAPLKEKISQCQEHMTPADAGQSASLKNNNYSSAVTNMGRRSVGPKPAIPPKPERLKAKQQDIKSTDTTNSGPTAPQPLPRLSLSRKDEPKQDLFKMNSDENSRPESVDPQSNRPLAESLQETEVRHQVHGSVKSLESEHETNVTAEGKRSANLSVIQNTTETAEKQVESSESKKPFTMKTVPVKPKRVKIAQPDKKNTKLTPEDQNSSTLTQAALTCLSSSDTNSDMDTYRQDKSQKELNQESKVEMREKKGRAETEDERRQRLSVHMDEIMRGNITAAMEIFDNLRKQEELQSILCQVEEIENDTSQVDVSSLRQVFESVPDWVVSSNRKKQKKVKVQNKEEKVPLTQEITESKSSMAHVFGDLERASEEIMNLKEQTLARLLDIEGAIKKALLSVSTLKSESDIAGLSCLFKESLGTVEGATSSGNISKISIGSSRTKSPPTKENPDTQANTAQVSHCAKPRVTPPSSPAFISIQSAARKTEVLPVEAKVCPACQHGPKTDETFRTTKTLTCNSPAQTRKQDPRKGGQKQSPQSPISPKRELSVLEVQTDHDGNSIVGTKTVTENYERTDNFGNRFYSSKTSITTTQPGTSTSQAGVSPAVFEVSKYPDVHLPISQKH